MKIDIKTRRINDEGSSGATRCQKSADNLLELDVYSRPFQLLLPGNRDKYKTLLGSFLTILTGVVLLSYAVLKFNDLIEHEQYTLQQDFQENFFDESDQFSSNFHVAAGLSPYDASPEPIEDPTYGQLKMYYFQWDIDDPNLDLYKEIPTKLCSHEDFNYSDSLNEESKFYPVELQAEKSLKQVGTKMKCITGDKLELFGNFNSQKTKNLRIIFEKCDREVRNDCKSDKEIDEWMFSKYIIMLINKKKFKSNKFESERIYKQSTLQWFPLSSNYRQDWV